MRVVALDLGGVTGFAWSDDGRVHPAQCGAWRVSRPKEARGARYARLAAELAALCHGHECSIGVEHVRSHGKGGALAAHAYGGYLATVERFAFESGFRLSLLGVPELKRYATGKGNASKADMLAFAQIRYGARLTSHDAADALHLLGYLLAQR